VAQLTTQLQYLTRLDLIAAGAYGQVFRVRGYSLRGEFRNVPLAYKQYKDLGGSGIGVVARTVMELREDLRKRNPRACGELDRFFAWPVDLVRHDQTGAVCGFLMPLAGKEFEGPAGSALEGRILTMDYLLYDNARRNALGLPDVPLTERLLLMHELAAALDLLHKEGWVFGDLSFKNVAFALNPPRIKVMDCDGVTVLGTLGQSAKVTAFWDPPEWANGPHEQNLKTDVFKLGLAIVRCLKPGLGATNTRDPGRLVNILDAEGVDLVTQALEDDPGKRPPARKLFEYLKKVTDRHRVPPAIGSVELLTPLVLQSLQGQEGQVSWQIDGATEISVLLDDQQPPAATVGPVSHPAGCVFPVSRSAKVTVLAGNAYGTDQRVAGHVTLVEIPPFSVDTSQMPRPEFPALAAFGVNVPGLPLPGPGGGLPGAPSIAVPRPGTAAIPVPVKTEAPALGGFTLGTLLRAGRLVAGPVRNLAPFLMQCGRRVTGLRMTNIRKPL